MENASKALIIAGAILLSILIIALGVFVFNQAKSAMGNVNLSEQEVAASNSKFESYQGKQKGSSAKALVSVIKNYNKTQDKEFVDIATEGKETNNKVDFLTSEPTYPTTILAGKTYNVSFDYNKMGQITKVYIVEQ